MTFGEYLKAQREKAGWTQPEAAAKAGIEQSYLSKLESGKNYPSEEFFDKLVAVYGFDVDDLRNKVASQELHKLREISLVRSAILHKENAAVWFVRNWMMAGAVLLILGTTFVVYQGIQGFVAEFSYKYRSQGIIRDGETVRAFEILKEREERAHNVFESIDPSSAYSLTFGPKPGEAYSDRLKYHTLIVTDDVGPAFTKTVSEGRRHYEFVEKLKRVYSTRNDLWLAFGVALIMAGLCSFFFSRFWR